MSANAREGGREPGGHPIELRFEVDELGELVCAITVVPEYFTFNAGLVAVHGASMRLEAPRLGVMTASVIGDAMTAELRTSGGALSFQARGDEGRNVCVSGRQQVGSSKLCAREGRESLAPGLRSFRDEPERTFKRWAYPEPTHTPASVNRHWISASSSLPSVQSRSRTTREAIL